jgi:hypothetical protein
MGECMIEVASLNPTLSANSPEVPRGTINLSPIA